VSSTVDPAPPLGGQLTARRLADPVGDDNGEHIFGWLSKAASDRWCHHRHPLQLQRNGHALDDQLASAVVSRRDASALQRIADLAVVLALVALAH
jgi:hypothetical protein